MEYLQTRSGSQQHIKLELVTDALPPLMFRTTFVLLLFSVYGLSSLIKVVLGISSVTSAQWQQLSQQVDGRLYEGAPFASPCFANGSDSSNNVNCAFVQAGYTDERMFIPHISQHSLISDSDTHERIWSIYQYPMGNLSGDWSTVSSQRFESFGPSTNPADNMSAWQRVKLLCELALSNLIWIIINIFLD